MRIDCKAITQNSWRLPFTIQPHLGSALWLATWQRCMTNTAEKADTKDTTIADVLQQRGQTDEALRIRREEQLPVYERLGDVREKIICRAIIGRDLIGRGKPEDRAEAQEHLEWALAEARRLQLPEASVIEGILARLPGE